MLHLVSGFQAVLEKALTNKIFKSVRTGDFIAVATHLRLNIKLPSDESLTFAVCVKQNKSTKLYLLALCMIILNEVLQEVHSLLSLDLVHFDQVLFRTKTLNSHNHVCKETPYDESFL